MDAFYEWVRGIACYLLTVSLLMLLLPDQKYRKYLKLATGLVFILLVAGPILRLLDLESVMEGHYQELESFLEKEEGGIPEEELEEKAAAAAVSAYEDWVREKAEQTAEGLGYEVAQCQVKTAEEEENRGELPKIYLRLRRKEREGWLVEPVVIGRNETGGRAESKAAGRVRKELEEVLGLEEEQIWIEEEK